MAPKSPREAAKSAKDIREAVQKELNFDPLVDATNISVKNMNSDVALGGTVPSYPQYLGADAAAKRVKGVTSVHNRTWAMIRPGTTPESPVPRPDRKQRPE